MSKLICAVDGVAGRDPRGYIGMCGSIKCSSDECGYEGECEHQREVVECDHDWEEVKPGIFQCTYPDCDVERVEQVKESAQ